MIDDEYPLGFRLALHRKDLGIALELARCLRVSLPVAALTASLEDQLMAEGHGDEDMSVLAHAIRTGATGDPGPDRRPV
jgi:3-hydroxyisobutyrate dehydrogenase-like beta-hydroxyacid dehydrogenase